MFLFIQIDLLILKTYYEQFTLTTKKSLHILSGNVPLHSGLWRPVVPSAISWLVMSRDCGELRGRHGHPSPSD